MPACVAGRESAELDAMTADRPRLTHNEYCHMMGRYSEIRLWARENGVEHNLQPPPPIEDDLTLDRTTETPADVPKRRGGPRWFPKRPRMVITDIPGMMTVGEVAEKLNRSRSYVRDLCQTGELRGLQFCPRGRWEIFPESVAALLDMKVPKI